MEAIAWSSSNVETIFRKLKSLPSGLDDMYRHTLARIDNASDEDAAIVYLAFAWISQAHPEKLLLRCLQHALSFSVETLSFDDDRIVDADLLLSLCHGLVELEETYGDPMVRFIRQSVVCTSPS